MQQQSQNSQPQHPPQQPQHPHSHALRPQHDPRDDPTPPQGPGAAGGHEKLAHVCNTQLECGICLSLLVEPITITCGHSFCRVCLSKCLRTVKKKCPTCRAVCYINAEDACENIVLAEIAKALHPGLYEQRIREAAAEKEQWSTLLPIFFYNVPMLPGERLSLHLFEPRYRLMMQRVVAGSRSFAYVPKYSSYRADAGDVALIAQVVEAEFLGDGRCLLEAKLTERKRIVETFVEDGTQGLHYCRLVDWSDEPMTAAQIVEFDEEARGVANLCNEVFSQHFRTRIEELYGRMPSTNEREAFSLWVCSVAPGPPWRKDAMLKCTEPLTRLTSSKRILEANLRRIQEDGGNRASAPISDDDS